MKCSQVVEEYWSCDNTFVINKFAYHLFSIAANPKRARLFHDKSLANEDTYEPFLS